MLELKSIPSWMEHFIGSITDGVHQTKESLLAEVNNIPNEMLGHSVISGLNVRIELFEKLKNEGILKLPTSKHIMQVQMGEIFKVYPDQERYYTKDSTVEKDGFVMLREYMGGIGFSSTWLGDADKCHSDIEVIVVPMLPMKFNK